MTPLDQALQGLFAALLSALTILIGYGVIYAKAKLDAWLKTKLSADQLTMAKTLAETIVHSLEQTGIWEQLDGPAKKAQAMAWMSQQLATMGIKMSPDDISRVIEEAVHKMNEIEAPALPAPKEPVIG